MSSLSTEAKICLDALFGFFLFAVLAWSAHRAVRWLLLRSARVAAAKTEKLSARGWRRVGLRGFVAILRSVLHFAYYLFIAFLFYALVWYQLRLFPTTRPWGDYLRSQFFALFSALGRNAMRDLPELAVLVPIVLVARLFAQVCSKVLLPIERGEIQARRMDPEVAAVTRRIILFVIWVIAAVVAYPYIPGSQSLAFKGVTVFAGLVLSLGSTNIINQLVSGLLLVYSRAFRAGDYVRIGDTEGTVMGIGPCATHICTTKNEEVYIANSVFLGASTKNFSRLAKAKGLFLPVHVTAGYRTPWRQVHAMLLEAARRTTGIAAEPPPFVLQARLSDFYVEYELNACLEQPERRVLVLSELHTHILDIFNEHGVQIMSPHYLQDPPHPQVVPRAEWFLAPAAEQGLESAPVRRIK